MGGCGKKELTSFSYFERNIFTFFLHCSLKGLYNGGPCDLTTSNGVTAKQTQTPICCTEEMPPKKKSLSSIILRRQQDSQQLEPVSGGSSSASCS